MKATMKVAFISTIFWFGIALSQVIEPQQKVEPRQNSIFFDVFLIFYFLPSELHIQVFSQ